MEKIINIYIFLTDHLKKLLNMAMTNIMYVMKHIFIQYV